MIMIDDVCLILCVLAYCVLQDAIAPHSGLLQHCSAQILRSWDPSWHTDFMNRAIKMVQVLVL